MVYRALIACSVTLLLLAGCAGRTKPAVTAAPPAVPPATSAATPPQAATAAPASPADAAANRNGDLNRIMGELQALGALDPQARDQLLKDLQQTDPALWPQVMEVFRASMAYRQRALARQAAAGDGKFTAAANPANVPPTGTAAAAPASGEAARQPAPLDGSLAVTAPASVTPAANSSQLPAAAASGAPATAIATVAGSALPTTTTTASMPAVRQVAHEEPLTNDPQQLLAKTIQSLESAPVDDNAAAKAARQVYLRMLYLAAGRRDDAMRPIAGLPSNEQQFWAEQMFGLSTYLDAERSPDAKRRAAEARLHLTNATGQLSESGELLVRNLAFCTEVHSFGVYTPFNTQQFKPGQQVILYAEVENFKSESTPKGFHTALRSSYQIIDRQGRQVTERDLGVTEEHCRNARRDYFIRYFLTIPARIYDGSYTLQLTIEDTLARKIGQATIDFTAKEK